MNVKGAQRCNALRTPGETFLTVKSASMSRHHPKSRAIVADSGSELQQYLAAKRTCRLFDAEFRPRVLHHNHTAQLNFLCRSAKSDVAVFLDQDCVLLAPLTSLLAHLEKGALLVGPRDEMWLTHPNFARRYPTLLNTRLREARRFVHASLMITKPKTLVSKFGKRPFSSANGSADAYEHQAERYYGLCNKLHNEGMKR
jgi:hypothetical protein